MGFIRNYCSRRLDQVGYRHLIAIVLLLSLLWENQPLMSWALTLIILIRVALDYGWEWNFYFPPPPP
jgi:hypothetical protein